MRKVQQRKVKLLVQSFTTNKRKSQLLNPSILAPTLPLTALLRQVAPLLMESKSVSHVNKYIISLIYQFTIHFRSV